ncbi:MAG: polymerase beta domain protein region protein [Chloroflexi bacterium]|nr:polymerase beta domain protein region protein [Chloroflexota bacterium]
MGRDWVNVRYFFDRARERLMERQPDPAGTGKDIGVYLHGQKLEDAVSKATSAYQRCVRAEQASDEGRLEAAHEAYLGVFGTYYPTA